MEKRLVCSILLQLLTWEIVAGDHLPKPPHCGKSGLSGSSLQERVFNGIPTRIDEYPWLGQMTSLSLLFDKIPMGSGSCTSTLITADLVLTAAHCVHDEYASKYPKLFSQIVVVRLGEWNTDTNPDCDLHKKCAPKSQMVGAKAVSIHPKYLGSADNFYHYDIALLRLHRKVKFTPYIQPICLPLSGKLKISKGQKFIATGWGDYNRNPLPNSLKRKALLTISDRKHCDEWYGENFDFNERTQLCVGGPDGSMCKGDSGGPLLLPSSHDENLFFQIGVASMSRIECINITRPAVYIRVDTFIDWIRSTVETGGKFTALKDVLGKKLRGNNFK